MKKSNKIKFLIEPLPINESRAVEWLMELVRAVDNKTLRRVGTPFQCFTSFINITEYNPMKTDTTDPKLVAADLMLLSKEQVSAKCSEFNITPTADKMKMIDQIIVKMFGLDECKKAFARR